MEENFWKALYCNATKSELAVLALYAQSVRHPYMNAICGPGGPNINMLDLDSLHQQIQWMGKCGSHQKLLKLCKSLHPLFLI
jgi:hypothetical protein